MPTGKTSVTAYTVVASLAKLARLPEWTPKFPEEMIALNAAFARLACDSPVKRLIACLPPRLFLRLIDAVFIPGMAHHYLFRKLLIESQLTATLSKDTGQVIILGAGLDTLALRLAGKHAAALFLEIDLPGTQRMKKRVLERIHHPLKANCVFIEADLSQTRLEEALRNEKRFQRNAPTVVILEGVLMYLSEAEVKALFAELRDLFTGSLMVIFGATAASDDAGPWPLRAINALLRRNQEGAKWFCPSRVMPTFMGDAGFEVKSWVSYGELQRHYRAEAETRRIPAEDENYYTVIKL